MIHTRFLAENVRDNKNFMLKRLQIELKKCASGGMRTHDLLITSHSLWQHIFDIYVNTSAVAGLHVLDKIKLLMYLCVKHLIILRKSMVKLSQGKTLGLSSWQSE